MLVYDVDMAVYSLILLLWCCTAMEFEGFGLTSSLGGLPPCSPLQLISILVLTATVLKEETSNSRTSPLEKVQLLLFKEDILHRRKPP